MADQVNLGHLAGSFDLNGSLRAFFSTSHVLRAAQTAWLAPLLVPVSESWLADVPAVCRFLQLSLWPEEAWLTLSLLKTVNSFRVLLPLITTQLEDNEIYIFFQKIHCKILGITHRAILWIITFMKRVMSLKRRKVL